jgi:hypothetical protein
VEAKDLSDNDLFATKDLKRVPLNLQTCHTALVGGYIVEGHVPIEDVERMLKEKPAILGIAVAGMPQGAPGMEQGATRQPFTTMAFTRDGQQTVFARH